MTNPPILSKFIWIGYSIKTSLLINLKKTQLVMTDEENTKKEILLVLYQDNINQGRHHETQRANITSAMLAIESIIIGIITFDKHIDKLDIPLEILLCVLGLFGAAFTLKHYERFSLHMERARVYRNRLDELFMQGTITSLKKSADSKHQSEYPKLSRLRLNYWWTCLHLLVTIIGLALIYLSIFSPLSMS